MNNTFLSDQWVIVELRNLKIPRINILKPVGCSKGRSKSEGDSYEYIHEKNQSDLKQITQWNTSVFQHMPINK
jgi:hypothetical protein